MNAEIFSEDQEERRALSIMVLIVCRNRRETTTAAIDRVQKQYGQVTAQIAVFDDGSDDGTPEAIATGYPEVTLVHGDGNAFWNGGLHQLWSHVSDAEVDAFLWLNDDTWLDPDAFTRLNEAWHIHRAMPHRNLILVGATRDVTGTASYGGYNIEPSPIALRLTRQPPNPDQAIPVDTFNGNIVLIGRGAMATVGLNDPGFFHNLGDVDYGLRATRAGIPVLLLPGTMGVCELNGAKYERGYGSPKLSMVEQWRKVNTHHGLPFTSWWRFTRRHSGKWWPLHFILPYRHLIRFW